jgi:glutamate:GABA antiporter
MSRKPPRLDQALTNPPLKKPLGLFTLTMINVIAIDNLRSLPFGAEFGSALVVLYLIAAVGFLLPVALVASELATTWPTRGGIYIWVREALGDRWALAVIWLQWIYNVTWYPMALSFITSTLATTFYPTLHHHALYTFLAVIVLYWLATLINLFGMKISSIMSTLGALVGTLIPMGLLMILGWIWYHQGMPMHITTTSFWPDLSDHETLPYFATIVFGLMGIEMSAMHADDVAKPESTFPKAMAISSILIVASLIGASLAIAMVIPHDQLDVITGISQALQAFLAQFHLTFLMPVMTLLIVIGGLGGVAAWIIGPTKGLLIAAMDGHIPAFFSKTNKHRVPARILLVQACLVTLISLFFITLPSVKSAYVFLAIISTQMALISYLILFAAGFQLRRSQPKKHRPFRIKGGLLGMGLITAIGGLTCLGTFVLSFIPPKDVLMLPSHYAGLLIMGMIVLCMPIFWLYKR